MKCNLITAALCVSLILLGEAAARAQGFKVSGTATLSSGYIWRGDKVCGVQINPSIKATYKGFALESYGFLALDGSYKEIDWDLSWTYKDFSFHLADYFYRGAGYLRPEDYFNFKKGETTHISEFILCYEPAKLPFCARWFTFFYGDWLPDSGRPTFSSYLELEAYHDFSHGGRLSGFVGSSILKGQYTGYTKDFAVVHLEIRYSRTIDLGPVSLPLSASYILNPFAGTSFLNASVGISF